MKRNMDYSMDDIEISISGLIIFLMRQWRLLIVCGLIGCLIGGAFQTIRVRNGALLEEQEDYEMELAAYQHDLDTYSQTVANCEKMIQDNQNNLQNSVFLNLDSDHVWVSTVLFDVIVEDSVLQMYNNTVINPYSMIAKSYIAGLDAHHISPEKRRELIGTDVLDYWNEVVSISETNDGRMITVTVKGKSKEFCGAVVDYLTEQIQILQESAAKQMVPHEIRVYSSSVIEDNYPSIMENREKINNTIADYRKKQVEAQRSLVKLQRKGEPGRPGKHIVKFAVIFGVIFGVLAVGLMVVRYLASGVIRDRNFVQLYDAPLVGCVRVSPARKNWIDRVIDKLQFKYYQNTDDEVSSIAAFLKTKAVNGPVTICGNAPKEDLQMLCSALSEKNGSQPEIHITDNILLDADSIQEAKASSGLLIVERIGASRMRDVFSEADRIIADDIPVLGWVLTE